MGYLHILGGVLKRKRIVTPSGNQVRPMPGSIRKSIFELLREVIPGKVIYDLFAGSGILGFEALSRGARRVYFVEKDRAICRLLQRNLIACGVEERGRVLCFDFFRLRQFPRSLERPEVVFVDPPFALDCSRVLAQIEHLKDFFWDALLVIRYPENQTPFENASCFQGEDLRKYGKSIIFFGRLRENFEKRE